jgi:hypothetical protein
MLGESSLTGYRCGDGGLGASKRDEERVTLGVDLTAVVLAERLAQDSPMLVEGLPVQFAAQSLEQLGGALNICEEESDGAYRQLVY